MSRLNLLKPENASGQTAEIYSAIKKSMGKVPNLYQTVGNNSNVLQTVLSLGPSLKLLDKKDQETIALVVGQFNNCEYCLAAHSLVATMNGITKDETIEIRRGESSESKRQALISFVREVLEKKGNVSDSILDTVKNAGYGEAHIPEIMLAVANNVFTNYFNNLNHTDLDFPAAQKI